MPTGVPTDYPINANSNGKRISQEELSGTYVTNCCHYFQPINEKWGHYHSARLRSKVPEAQLGNPMLTVSIQKQSTIGLLLGKKKKKVKTSESHYTPKLIPDE